jgi:hypothetical protein
LVRVILFAALGAAIGAAAVEFIDLLPNDQTIQIFRPTFTIPGLVFGVVFGIALLRLKLVRAAGAVAYAAASTLSNMAATTLAVAIDDPIGSILPNGIAAFGVTGFIAGAVGGGLLAGVTALLIRHLRWPLLIVAGAVLGAFLPLIDLSSSGGAFLFYAIWQAGYAATLAAILPRTGNTPARSQVRSVT